jgi:hypothetical protein
MDFVTIPHAELAYVDHSRSPHDTLVVITRLVEHSQVGDSGNQRDALMRAMVDAKIRLGIANHEILWGADV